MKTFVGTKLVCARAMTRGEYNTLRGWTPPAGEDQSAAGYLVEYLDSGEPNVAGYVGYVSWSPAPQFEAAYVEVGSTVGLPPHLVRVLGEQTALNVNITKLCAFIETAKFNQLPEAERHRLLMQRSFMEQYSQVLGQRLEAGRTAQEV